MMELSDPQQLGMILYTGAIALIVIGLFAIVTRHHIIRILLGLTILEAGVNLMLVAGGFRTGAIAPIITDAQQAGVAMVDPIPQALILTAIVIGVGVLALALALTVEVYRSFGTLDTRELAARIAMEQTETATPELVHTETPTLIKGDYPEAVEGGRQ